MKKQKSNLQLEKASPRIFSFMETYMVSGENKNKKKTAKPRRRLTLLILLFFSLDFLFVCSRTER